LHFNSTHAHLCQNLRVLVCLCISLPDEDLVEVETYTRDVSDSADVG
jgi:hypothetical protein